MVTLAQARRHLRDRIAEEGVEFWSSQDEVMYINLAQNFIAAVTRGVTAEVEGQVGRDNTFLPLPPRVINAHQLSGYIDDSGDVMGTVSAADANLISPSWRNFVGKRPKWFILDVDAKRAYVSPIPHRDVTVNLRVSVLPAEVTDDSDELFNGVDAMDKYFNATINMAAMYAFHKERYDGEAERAYGWVINELQQLGVNPNAVPPFQQVVSDASNSR